MTINIEDVRPGDVVTLEQGASKLVLSASGIPSKMWLWLSENPDYPAKTLDWYVRHGWTLTDHKPKAVLPTEPGVYVSPDFTRYGADMTLWWLEGLSGSWFTDASGSWDYADSEDVPSGLVRLVPENESRAKIAAEVIDWIDSDIKRLNLPTLTISNARKHFGAS